MRNNFLLLISFLLGLASCHNKKDKFEGVWLAYKVENMRLDNLTGSYNGMQIQDFRGKGHLLDSFLQVEEYRLLGFQNDGTLLDDSEIMGQKKGSWKLSDNKKQLLLKSARGNETFDILKLKKNAIVIKKRFEKSKDSILYTLVPFQNDKTEDMKKCFEYLMTKPAQAETDEQIKMRLKNALEFYSLYFHIINTDVQVNSFKPARIYLPISYYSNGIGLKPFSPDADWVYLFYNSQDAAKAYEHLNLALKKVGVFPSHGNRFALEYAEVFKEMADNL